MSARLDPAQPGPACARCGETKHHTGSRWRCSRCYNEWQKNRRTSLPPERRKAERARANKLRAVARAKWTPEERAAANAAIEEWRRTNREAYLEGSRRWYRENREKVVAQKAAEYLAKPAEFIARSHKRKALLRAAVCGHGEDCVSSAFLADLYARPCLYCGAPATDADHYMPLSRGGLHCRGNLVPACEPCNGSKYNHDPIEWMRSRSA